MTDMNMNADQIYAFIVKQVKKDYPGLTKEDKEDVIQGTAEQVFRVLENYDPERGDFLSFLLFHTMVSARKEYWGLKSNLSASTYKKAKRFREAVENGLPVREACKKLGVKKETTAFHYMQITARTISMDEDGEARRSLHETVPAPEQGRDPKAAMREMIEALDGEERFVAEVYAKNFDRKDWRRATLEECTEWGLTKKKTSSILKKIRGK